MSKFRKPGNWWTPAGGILTEQQACALADVITEWSVLEIGLQKALCVLAQAPLALGQALTEDLGPDNRIKALKRLAHTWQGVSRRLEPSETERIALAECLMLATWITQVKGRRNQIAHWSWFRSSEEELFGFKYRTRPIATYADQKNLPQTDIIETVTGLKEFAGQINFAAERLHRAADALQKLPTWPRTHVAIDVEPERPEHLSQSEPLPPRQS